jgi:GPH family glycoside/pentoside/hexuronide:cation symporter
MIFDTYMTTLSQTTPASPSLLSPLEKTAYGLGDLASGLLWSSINLFLMFFYTEVFGLTAAAAGTLLFVARAFDAVWDLYIGYRVDRTRSRFGRCRPYLLFGAPLLACSAIATFTVPGLEGNAKLVYAYATYVGMMMAYSLVNIPYSAMPALLSADPAERTSLSVYRMFLAFCGGLIVSAVTLPLVQWFGAGDRARGYQWAVATLALLAVLLFWACFAGTRERINAPTQAPDLRRELSVLLRTRAWWLLFVAGMVQFTAAALPNSTALYLVTYVSGHAEWGSGYFVTASVGMLTGVLVSGQMVQRWCKRSVVMVTTLCSAACLLLLYAIDPTQRVQVYAWIFCVNSLGAVKIPIIWSMVADTADHIELRSGRRIVGLTTSSVAFSNKFGIGLGAGLVGLLLGMFGYQPGAPQSAQTQAGIVFLMSALPALLYVSLAGLYAIYPLHRQALAEQKKALQRQRHAGPAGATVAAASSSSSSNPAPAA